MACSSRLAHRTVDALLSLSTRTRRSRRGAFYERCGFVGTTRGFKRTFAGAADPAAGKRHRRSMPDWIHYAPDRMQSTGS